MKAYNIEELTSEKVEVLCRRNPVFDSQLLSMCEGVFEAVGSRGDQALRELTLRYDSAKVQDIRVPASKLPAALRELPDDVIDAMEVAIGNIRKFHSSQRLAEEPVEVQPGVTCWRASRAIESIGIYVPGGTAVLPSTVLMLAVPAKLAGCSRIVLCVPPQPDGSVSESVLGAAYLSGVRHVFAVGGAQAIAAMALGTETIPKVDKILGPGNRYVQTAKILATYRGVSIDMVAGPSEVLVIADDSADPAVVASDLISQAEHGADSQVVLVTTSASLMNAVPAEVASQLASLPRKDLASRSLDQSFAVLTPGLEKAFEFSNQYAPEHLILNIENPRKWLGRIQNAGSVFVGTWSPEVAGDYAAGTNHTLPTSGSARNVSGVSMDSFVKKITFQELSKSGLRDLGNTLEVLAGVESLDGHARAVRTRLEKSTGDLQEEPE
jgi:histidinol dehydrogenase